MQQYKKNLGKVSLTSEGAWAINKPFEILSIVYDENTKQGFISRKDVPIGVDINNREYWMSLNVSGYADNNIIILSEKTSDTNIKSYTLEEAINSIASVGRKPGAILGFYNENSDRLDIGGRWEVWQFNSTTISEWENVESWQNIYYNYNKFVGWYKNENTLKQYNPFPEIGCYAFVGTKLNEATIYRCENKYTWTDTTQHSWDYVKVIVEGNVTVGENGNWFNNGVDTNIPASVKGENGKTPVFRNNNNVIEVSYDNVEWNAISDEIAAWFRWQSEGGQQAKSTGKIQITRDGITWTDLSGEFVNNLRISRYIGAGESLPTTGIVEGTIYAKGPTYSDEDVSHANPIYRLWVYAWKGNTLAWQDNGEFQSIAAGIVQETGDGEGVVMSQKAVTKKLSELGSEVGIVKQVLKTTARLFTKNEIPQGSTIKYHSLVKSGGVSYLRVFDKNGESIKTFCEVYTASNEDTVFEGEYVLPENYEYVLYYVFVGEVEIQIEASTSNKLLHEVVKNTELELNQVLKKVDLVQVVDNQVSETPKWAFEGVLNNQIVYARILTDRRVNEAEVFNGGNSLGIILSSNFQRCDLSNVDKFQVYLSLDSAGSVTLEYIKESELTKWIMEDKFMFQYEERSSENAVMGFKSILTGRKGYARITSEYPITNSIVFNGSESMGFSIPKNGDWIYLDCSKYENFGLYLSSTQETKVVLDFVEDTLFSEIVYTDINKVKKDVSELKDKSYLTKTIIEGVKKEYYSTYTYDRPFSFDLSDAIIDIGIAPSDINIEYSSENFMADGLFVEAETANKGTFAKFYNSEVVSAEGNVYHYRFNLPFVDSLLSDVDDTILKYKVTCQISGEATTENPHIITLFDVTAKFYFKQGTQFIEKELDKVKDKVNDNENSVNYEWRGYTNMKKVTVKKDGSGDFTTIQDAINSIQDASPLNQYDVQVYDDFIISDSKELYKVGGYKNTEDNPSSTVALFFMKDWVHVRGMGRQIKLSIESPKDLPAASFPNIQVIYPCGNNILDNFYVSIKGGRYAIHHESGGAKNSQDYHATTIFRNITAEHFGNNSYPNSNWTSTYAQANGTTSGTNWIYENCKWISHETYPYYSHKNSDFDEPCHITFINCSMITFAAKNMREISQGCYFGDIGSNVCSDTTIIGCNFVGFSSFGYGNVRGLETIRIGDDIRLGGLNLHGHSNTKMAVSISNKNTLIFHSKNNGSISVVGGTAYDLLWGETFRTYFSSKNYPCTVVGIRKIFDRNVSWGQKATNVYSLAYRLGNCVLSPKTLVLNIDGVNVTITFNKNYMTSDGSNYTIYTEPYMNNEAIASEINSFLSAYGARCEVVGDTEYKSYEDCEECGYNKTGEVIPSGKFLVRDYSNGAYAWRLAKSSDTKIEGYSGERIPHGGCGRVILTNKVLIPIYPNSNIGEKYTINDNSALEITSDNDKVRFVSVDGSVVEQV